MSIEPGQEILPTEPSGAPEAKEPAAEAAAHTMIFEDASRAPRPIRDPKSASLIFRPSGQGCFP